MNLNSSPMKASDGEINSRDSTCILTIENRNVLGGLGGEVAEILKENHPTFMKVVGIRDTFSETSSNDDPPRGHLISAHNIQQGLHSADRKSEERAAYQMNSR